jgi:hypothetical protein
MVFIGAPEIFKNSFFNGFCEEAYKFHMASLKAGGAFLKEFPKESSTHISRQSFRKNGLILDPKTIIKSGETVL